MEFKRSVEQYHFSGADWGIVQAVSPHVEVAIAGDTTFTKITSGLDTYTPATGDKVILLKVDLTWIILGKLVTL